MFADISPWLTQDILIERPTVGGGFSQETTWATVDTVKGYIRSTGGSESIDYGGDNVRATQRLVTAVTDIKESDRVTHGDNTYLVRYVDTKSLDGESWLQIDLEYVGAAQ